MSKFCRLVVRIALVVCAMAGAASWAEIPDAARKDPRFQLGYLVVTHYEGVKSDGTGDSTQGIQQAIEDAFDNDKSLLFPSGEYVISDSLRCYKYQLWSKERAARFVDDVKRAAETPDKGNHTLLGEATGRPIIRLPRNAKGFQDPGDPRPLTASPFSYGGSSASKAV